MDEQEKKEKLKSYYERYVRWQQLRIQQLSYVNNLFLGLTTGLLGFLVTKSNVTFNCNCWIFTIQVLTFLGLTISLITGILLVLNRLKDFRKTTWLVGKRIDKFELEQNNSGSTEIDSIKNNISILKSETDALGKYTWILLQWQIWTFTIGSLLGFSLILITNDMCG